MSGYVRGAGEGDAVDRRGARVVLEASGGRLHDVDGGR
jgi:hypothetical protein